MVEGTTMAFTEAIQLAYNRDQLSYRQLGNQKRPYIMSTTSRRHHPEILQVNQTHQSHCLLQKIHTPLQTIQGQQASSHPLHTRSGPGSDLLCEDGTAGFLCTRNQGFKGTTRSCFQQFSQDTAPIH